MTWQVALLFLVPFLLATNVWVIRVGSKGRTRLHAAARYSGVAGVIACLGFVVALLDRLSQVWVLSSADGSGTLYVASAAVFTAISIVALTIGIATFGKGRSC
jgi:hypothetical protein